LAFSWAPNGPSCGQQEAMGWTVESIQGRDGKHYLMKLQTVTLDSVGYLDRSGEKQFDSTFERGILLFINLKNEE